MKCHYEVLGVSRNASDDDLKKAYRKLALKWHPDKNLDTAEQAKEQFQIVQQAWEVLSDPHERAWYDNHYEAILKGGIGEDYKDDSIDLFQYFSTTCFKGYGDNEKGFYTVYRTVFEKLTAEDAEFAKDGNSDEIPGFGDSQSSYTNVVHNFYAYWQSYSTKRSFAWLDSYDVRNASNRKVARFIEKKNKIIRDKAKRERNEQVRNLVAFVRKRDERVQAHAKKLAERARDNLKKVEERKKQQLLERQKQLREHTESEWSKFSNIEAELKNIEANLAREFGENLSSETDIEDENTVHDNTLYCVACNKIFKTHKAYTNHENSKKHKDNIVTMKASMIKDDKEFESSQDSDISSQSASESNKKLATDSQMPDFLLNPVQNSSSYNEDNTKEETSEEELISDDDDDEHSENPAKIKQKKYYAESTNAAVDSQMDSAIYIPHKVTENDNECVTSEDELISDQEDEEVPQPKKQKKKKRKKNIQNSLTEQASEEEDTSINEDAMLSKKQRKKQQQKKALLSKVIENNQQVFNDKKEIEDQTKKENLKENNVIDEKNKSKKSKNVKNLGTPTEKTSKSKSKNICIRCKVEFPSQNKLFEHLKKTNHYKFRGAQ
ncbi:dnaJ homolog subfamily C member 21-like isoform X1 [Colletes gigas]|uniref:dnaJ homolog subfamily C member 21-like isoform X1 n=1 Tax=Colletes gigas TaxID=935657 RepID=UPI001C9B88A8|nr:dnaJ homolog subfamily C member 21-like isoform X1 [Colletes gigas]XP_043262569.1 dnaJ homolog subfamily C member 21-like isoform X1 [Colletes gigas]